MKDTRRSQTGIVYSTADPRYTPEMLHLYDIWSVCSKNEPTKRNAAWLAFCDVCDKAGKNPLAVGRDILSDK